MNAVRNTLIITMTLVVQFGLTGHQSFGAAEEAFIGQAKKLEGLISNVSLTMRENERIREEFNEANMKISEIEESNNRLLNELKSLKDENYALESDVDKLNRDKEMIGKWKERVEELEAESEKIRDAQLKVVAKRDLPESTEGTAADFAMQLESLSTQGSELETTINAEMGDLYYNLGNMLYESKKYEVAAENFAKAIEFNPHDAWAYHNLAILMDYHLYHTEIAIDAYENYIKYASADEKTAKIRQRLIDLKLQRHMVPSKPIKKDYDQYQRDIR